VRVSRIAISCRRDEMSGVVLVNRGVITKLERVAVHHVTTLAHEPLKFTERRLLGAAK
jgi:hypothetical protein